MLTYSFNSRTREGCDSSFRSMSRFANVFQFTHPGGVRLSLRKSVVLLVVVSIHAPGRGATSWFHPCRDRRLVSIHAPGRGATGSSCPSILPASEFQFTHPGGVRLFVSIVLYLLCCFNSRTREGCDRLGDDVPIGLHTFQFTHPGGVRHITARRTIDKAYRFNSRTREGCDQRGARRLDQPRRFQFTHPGGVRRLLVD